MAIEVRILREEEFEEYAQLRAIAFGFDFRPGEMLARREILDIGRSHVAIEDGLIVGSAAAFTYRMGVPGGEVACAGVTGVTVQPTHRRRGALTAMMRTQLDDVRDRGEPVAALWASEAIIYGRFGYGLANEQYHTRIERAHSAIAATPAKGRCRLVSAEEARAAFEPIWEAERRRRPGMMTRSEAWWRVRVFEDPAERRNGMTANRYVLYEEDGTVLGYVVYRVQMSADEGNLSTSKLVVSELLALTRQAQVGLWQYIYGVDLIHTIEAELRPEDDLVPWILADRRRLRRIGRDALWLRLIDVPAAFQARRARADGRFVAEVPDTFLPWAGGRFAFEAEGGTLTVKPTTETAQLTMPMTSLASMYLGSYSASRLALMGLIEGDPRHLAIADSVLTWPVAPWCPEIF